MWGLLFAYNRCIDYLCFVMIQSMRLLPLAVAGILVGLCACVSDEHRAVVNEAEMVSLDMRSDSLAQYADCFMGAEGEPVPLKTHSVGRLDEVFNDSNYVHLAAAEEIGIEPLTNLRSHWQLRQPIYKIVSCKDFYVEHLDFSAPYMVAEGVAMLHEIGSRFRDSLQARGGGDYRIRVTSVTRTAANVKRLRRRNRNAIDSSVHQFGTTVDISYNSFAATPGNPVPRTMSQLKELLAEVLDAMHREGKLLVKYEKKQPCFHITATPRKD